MKRFCFFLLVKLALFPLLLFGQTNAGPNSVILVKPTVSLSGSRIVVRYSVYLGKNVEKCETRLFMSTDGGHTFSNRSMNFTGDIGTIDSSGEKRCFLQLTKADVKRLADKAICFKLHVTDKTLKGPDFAPFIVVTTGDVAVLSSHSVQTGGNVKVMGDHVVTAKGIVWGTSPEPLFTNNPFSSDGVGSGPFETTINGLSPSTTYYYRAYAVVRELIFYGEQRLFTTVSNESVK